MGGGFRGWGFNDLVSPPQTPSPTASVKSTVSESSTPVYVNNQAIEVPERLKADVCNAADRIRFNWANALSLEGELVLNPDILIPLLNHAKLYWHDWLLLVRAEASMKFDPRGMVLGGARPSSQRRMGENPRDSRLCAIQSLTPKATKFSSFHVERLGVLTSISLKPASHHNTCSA